jgi:hypothetical protein
MFETLRLMLFRGLNVVVGGFWVSGSVMFFSEMGRTLALEKYLVGFLIRTGS